MQKMTIMLVDDEERFLSTTRKLLLKRGYEVLTANGGAEAFNQLNTHDIHVVILDIKMPGMDGITVLREIKKQYPLVEVILLTGHATMETAVEGLKAGATDYMIKPADIDEIIDKSEEAFVKRRRLEEKIRTAQQRSSMQSPVNAETDNGGSEA